MWGIWLKSPERLCLSLIVICTGIDWNKETPIVSILVIFWLEGEKYWLVMCSSSVIEHPRLVHCLLLSITIPAIAISRTFPAQLGSYRSLTEMPQKLPHQTGIQSMRTPASDFRYSEWQRFKTRASKSL